MAKGEHVNKELKWEVQNKEVEELNTYSFPKEWRTIKAKSYEDAKQQILNSNLSKND